MEKPAIYSVYITEFSKGSELGKRDTFNEEVTVGLNLENWLKI